MIWDISAQVVIEGDDYWTDGFGKGYFINYGTMTESEWMALIGESPVGGR